MGRRQKVMIYGNDYPTRDGTCERDYIHTDDLAQAHQLAVEALEPGMGRAYNVGTGTGATVLEVLRACEEAVGRPIPHEFAGRRPGDPAVSDRLARQARRASWAGRPASPTSATSSHRLEMASPPPRWLRGTERITSAFDRDVSPSKSR